MNRWPTRLALVLALACAFSVPAARAQSLLFDYVGFDYENPELNPGLFLDVNDGYQGVGEVGSLFLPLVADTANFQYTYFFDGLIVGSRINSFPFVIINFNNPGTLTIYEDAKVGGTPADYGTNPPSAIAPPTFTDGTPILVGKLTNFQYILNTGTNTGSFEADFEAIGGTQLGNFPLNQRVGWTFAGTSGSSVTVPTGYDHQVDGQTFLNPPTPTHNSSWGRIKARYR